MLHKEVNDGRDLTLKKSTVRIWRGQGIFHQLGYVLSPHCLPLRRALPSMSLLP